MKMREIYAIGDVHGCNSLLIKLLATINPQKDDTLIFLGDVIDRGEDSKGVLDTIIYYQSICQVILIQGNHEEMMLGAIHDKEYLKYWLKFGGIETLQSFGVRINQQGLRQISYDYYNLLKSSLPYYETEDFIFTHATPFGNIEMKQQTDEGLRWRFIPPDGQDRHISGKTVICGHSAQESGKVYHRDGLICIDTHAYGGGALTALEVTNMQVYQIVDNH